MCKTLFLLFAFCSQWFFLQNIILNKVERINDNKDKFFYQIEEHNKSVFLGEILVNGFSNNDVFVFGEIYKKAKQIGGNTFSLKPIENVDGSLQPFNPSYYILNVYYTKADDILGEHNVAYLISSSDKSQKININNKTTTLQSRSFLRLELIDKEVLTVSTRKLLGSSVKLSGKEDQPALYFAVSDSKIRSNNSIYGGINLKSGDITGLEKSFGMFLTTIYKEQKKD